MKREKRVLKLDNAFTSERYIITSDGKILDSYNNVLDVGTDSRGYITVKLNVVILNDDYDECNTKFKSKTYRLHRLVAQNFIIKNEEDYKYKRDKVFLLDRSKLNVGKNNLLWCNQREINSLMIFINKGLDECVDYMVDKNLDIEEMEHVLFDSRYIKKKLFRRKYLQKLLTESANRQLQNKNE